MTEPPEDDLGERLSALEKRLRIIERRQKTSLKWQKRVAQKMDALLRAQYLEEFVALGAERPFHPHRFNLYSQNEEDGITLALLREAGVVSRKFVELGCGSTGGNSAVLAFELGWSGLMVDVVASRIESLEASLHHNPGVRFAVETVSPDNVNALVARHHCAGEIDFLSLDIDSYDYWVFDALDACSPRLLVLEYNAGFGPEVAVTVPADAPIESGLKGYHGASLAAMTQLAERKDYRLITCDPSGTNAYFLRNDIRPDIPGVSVKQAFRPPMNRFNPLEDEIRDPGDLIERARVAGLPLQFL